MKNKKGETKGKIKKLYTDKIILTPEKQKAIRKNFQELENSIRLLKKEIKEMPEIDYEKVYQYDSYTYLLLHKAFEEEGMKLKKGDKVIPTKWAIQNGICKEKDKGIVEGFGRKRYKQDYIRFLVYAHSSCEETIEHLELLFETKSLKNKEKFDHFMKEYDKLGRKLNKFVQAVENA